MIKKKKKDVIQKSDFFRVAFLKLQPFATSFHVFSLCMYPSIICISLVCVHVEFFSVVSNSLQPYGLQPTRLLCPWDSPGKNTGVGCHALLQGIFPIQGLNPSILHLLHWEVGSLPLAPLGKPLFNIFI